MGKKSKNIYGLLFAVAFAAYAFSYLGRNTFSSCLKIMAAQGLFETGFDAYISAAYLIMYGSGQLINGILITKFSPKLWIPLGLCGSGLANILMTVAGNQYLYVLLWGLNGFCCSMLWPSVIQMLTAWMNKAERERAAANISPSIPVGSIGCYLISFFMLKISSADNWKFVFLLSGTLLCSGALLLALIFIEKGRIINAKAAATREEEPPAVSSSGKKVRFTLPLVFTTGLIVLVAGAFFNGTLKEAVITYVPNYISDCFGFGSDTAALICTLLPVFAILGPYFGIFLNKKFFNNECTTVGVLMAISALCNLVVFLTGSRISWLSILLIAVSTACMWGINTMLMTFTTYHFAKMGASSIVSGILNCTVFVGSAIFTVVYRNIESASGWNITVLAWALMGAAAAAVTIGFARVWGKRRPE